MTFEIVIACASTLAAILVAMMALRARAGRRSAMASRTIDQVEPSPVATLRSRTADEEEFYAPAFIVEPGRCFRLCREPASGAAHACDQHVVGRGQFLDHRGNTVEVEACGAHMVDLVNWRFRTVDG